MSNLGFRLVCSYYKGWIYILSLVIGLDCVGIVNVCFMHSVFID
jgi:hypothetical protein